MCQRVGEGTHIGWDSVYCKEDYCGLEQGPLWAVGWKREPLWVRVWLRGLRYCGLNGGKEYIHVREPLWVSIWEEDQHGSGSCRGEVKDQCGPKGRFCVYWRC